MFLVFSVIFRVTDKQSKRRSISTLSYKESVVEICKCKWSKWHDYIQQLEMMRTLHPYSSSMLVQRFTHAPVLLSLHQMLKIQPFIPITMTTWDQTQALWSSSPATYRQTLQFRHCDVVSSSCKINYAFNTPCWCAAQNGLTNVVSSLMAYHTWNTNVGAWYWIKCWLWYSWGQNY